MVAITEGLDLDEWERVSRPVALGLGVRPWEWDQGRLTPRDLDDMLAAAERTRERQLDMAAWVTAHLMNATGNYKQAQTVKELLRRDPLPADPRGAGEKNVEHEAIRTRSNLAVLAAAGIVKSIGAPPVQKKKRKRE